MKTEFSFSREIIIDTETTGLSPRYGHRIVEIACIELCDFVPSSQFHCCINPRRNVPVSAAQIHGLTTEFLADKPGFEGIVSAFLKFVEDASLIFHNAPFDMRFINFELDKVGFSPISMRRVCDTLSMARRQFPELKSHSLDALCDHFGIDNSARIRHSALSDAELLAKVYGHLAGKKVERRSYVSPSKMHPPKPQKRVPQRRWTTNKHTYFGCPFCVEGRLVRRRNRRNRNYFYGCSKWPACQYTKSAF